MTEYTPYDAPRVDDIDDPPDDVDVVVRIESQSRGSVDVGVSAGDSVVVRDNEPNVVKIEPVLRGGGE